MTSNEVFAWEQLKCFLRDETGFQAENVFKLKEFQELLDVHRVKNLYQHFQFEKHKILDKRCLIQRSELIRLSQFFQLGGLPFIVIKGLPLSQFLYQDSQVRQSKDIDILIDEKDLMRAHFFLKNLGYIASLEIDNIHYKSLSKIKKKHKDIQYLNVDNCIQIELHWRLSSFPKTFDVPFKMLHERSKEVSFYEQTLFTLSDEDNYLYLCMHHSRHAFLRLQWLKDIQLYREKSVKINLFSLCKRAQELNVERHFLVSHNMCKMLFEDPLDSSLRKLINKKPYVQKLSKKILRMLEKYPSKGLQGRGVNLALLYEPFLMPNFRLQVHYFIHRIFKSISENTRGSTISRFFTWLTSWV